MFFIRKQKSIFVIENCLSLFKSHLVFDKICFGFVFVPFENHICDIYNIYTSEFIVNSKYFLLNNIELLKDFF